MLQSRLTLSIAIEEAAAYVISLMRPRKPCLATSEATVTIGMKGRGHAITACTSTHPGDYIINRGERTHSHRWSLAEIEFGGYHHPIQ